MTLHTVAAEIARRIPEMAQDSPINNAEVIERMFQELSPTTDDTESLVCADIQTRQAKGLAKYGTSVRNNPLPLHQWLQHAYEEHLDAAIYLKRAIQELHDIDAINKGL